jgi:ribosomal protein S18 acetylase RimI-like enzyme
MNLSLRPASDEDQDFLFRVYASTRADEMAMVDWNDQQKQDFLQMQFNAQTTYYRQHYPDAEYSIILHEGVSAGRLIVDRREIISIIDIALLPEHRDYGIGTKFIGDLKVEAEASGKPLQLHVENFNRAQQLYERLGFRKIGEAGFYWLMEWSPEKQEPVREPQDGNHAEAFGVGKERIG